MCTITLGFLYPNMAIFKQSNWIPEQFSIFGKIVGLPVEPLLSPGPCEIKAMSLNPWDATPLRVKQPFRRGHISVYILDIYITIFIYITYIYVAVHNSTKVTVIK